MREYTASFLRCIFHLQLHYTMQVLIRFFPTIPLWGFLSAIIRKQEY